MNSAQEGQKGRRGRSKRHEVLTAATDRFGRDGYEHTKWADIAADIGVGATALYHYFESKQHCLYEIMDEAIEDFRSRFVAIIADERDSVRAFEAVMAELLRPLRARRAPQPRAGRRAGPASSPSSSEREEQARQAARSRMRELEFAWASFLATRDARRRDPGDRPAPAHARRARPLQQHLALVPAERDHRAEPHRRATTPSWRWRDRPAAGRPRAGARRGMSFFERYFEALDGPEPYSSLDLVSDDVEFAIEWANGEDRKATQLRGGKERAARLHRRRRHGRLGALRRLVGQSTATRSSRSARRAGTTAASSARSSRSRTSTPTGGWTATWSAARPRSRFPTRSRMHAELLAGTPSEPVLLGSECRRCGTVSFPRQGALPALHVDRRRGAPARPPRHALELDDPALPPEVPALHRARRSSSPTASATSSCRARCASRRA